MRRCCLEIADCTCVPDSQKTRRKNNSKGEKNQCQVMNVRVMRSNDLEMKLINRLTRWHSFVRDPRKGGCYFGGFYRDDKGFEIKYTK